MMAGARAGGVGASPLAGGRGLRLRGGGTAVRTFLLAVIAAAMAQGSAAANDWNSFGMGGTGSHATVEVLGARFAPLWTSTIPNSRGEAVYKAVLASPAVADGFIAVATYGNRVRVLREEDGAALWDAELGDAAVGSPVIDRGWLYVPCLDRNIYAFRLTDGKRQWKTELGGIIYSSPLVADGSLLVVTGTPQSRLVRLNSETGQVIWSAGADVLVQSVESAVVVAGDQVLVAEVNARLHSFSLADGHHQWMRQGAGTPGLTSPGLAAPVVVGTRAYLPLGGPTASLLAVELATGEIAPGWPVDLTAAVATATGTPRGRVILLSSLAAADGLIVLDGRVDDSVDSDANGLVDLYRSREMLVTIDTASGAVVWTAANGSRDVADPNLIPGNSLVPTPAIHRGAASEALVAVGSSLASQVALWSLRTGARVASFTLPSGSRASPAVANARLIVATDAGAVMALASRDNQPPTAPLGLRPAGGAPSDGGGTVVSWRPVMDSDGDAVSYQLRWDNDGETLHNAAGEVTTAAGVISWRLPPIAPGSTITYALRARDARGAWSAWSAPATFTTVSTPTVNIGDTSFGSLLAALAGAQRGDVIRLGRGRYPLAEPMNVPAGVTVEGAGPGLTVLDGHGLARAVTLSTAAADQPATLRNLTVKGAATGVATEQGANAVLQNVIISDNSGFGIDVGASATVTVISATLFRNGAGARSFGALKIRNSIVTQNGRGLVGTPADALLSRYNDLFANRDAAYEGVSKGMGDLAREVSFLGVPSGDLRVAAGAATTDQGDPADDFSAEPSPNGGRINMGAYAGTSLAELSQLSSAVGSPYAAPTPVNPPVADSPGVNPPGIIPAGPRPVPEAASAGGCALAPGAAGGQSWWALAVAAALLRRRRRKP